MKGKSPVDKSINWSRIWAEDEGRLARKQKGLIDSSREEDHKKPMH